MSQNIYVTPKYSNSRLFLWFVLFFILIIIILFIFVCFPSSDLWCVPIIQLFLLKVKRGHTCIKKIHVIFYLAIKKVTAL